MDKIQNVKILLKNTHINFLLGAGTSYNKVDDSVSFPLMSDLLDYIRADIDVKHFYNDIKKEPICENGLLAVVSNIFDKYLFSEDSNVEKFLSALDGMDFYIPDEELKGKIRDIQIQVKKTIRERIKQSEVDTVKGNYINFYNGLKSIKQINSIKNQTFNIFTTNYDMMNEMAMESLNIHYYSGFEGIVRRKFNLAYYNYGFVDNFVVNNTRVQVTPEHINLFKLHGSLSWRLTNNELLEMNPFDNDFIPEIIYPSVDKFNNTNLIISYSALMREFSNRLCRKDTTLFVSGLSMGDEHINKIIENALTINTFHLVIFACGSEDMINNLKKQYQKFQNVIIIDESYTFEKVADLLLSLEGANADA